MQVDLGLLRFVSGIGTQGAVSKETKKKYFVKSYKIDISSNGEDWITLKDGNKPLVRINILFFYACNLKAIATIKHKKYIP